MIALLLLAAAPVEQDWAAIVRGDAAALHADIRANHPGPVNAADPGFGKREETAYARLVGRAAAVRDLSGYRFAFKEYIASFDDGHVQYFLKDDKPLPAPSWPGFLTGFDGQGRQRVMTRADDMPVPLGAELVGCDGVPAATLAARNVGAFEGRWGLASFRANRGGYLLVDRGNPFVRRPVACDLRVRGKVRRVALAWRPMVANGELGRRLSAVSGISRPPIGARTLADGTRWFAMSDFNGDPHGPTARALVPMLEAMRVDRVAVARAPAVVLDVRGNGGGSSDWSRRVAKALWGERRVAAREAAERNTYVKWRASPAVQAAIDDYVVQFGAAPTPDPATLAYFRTIATGLRQAQAAGRPLWREPDEASAGFAAPPTGAEPDPAPLAGPVYVVADAACASACLDAIDLWRALGAVQIGRETSADTTYMDVREGTLPSGLAGYAVPMKVYRGRARGSNVPWTPVHFFTGDLTDTPALERWVATLPERRR